MKHLSIEDIIALHTILIERFGGVNGVRDLGRLEAVTATQTQQVFGLELYQGVIEKAAAMTRGVIADHPFFDGNKRTGILAGLTLLELNGLQVTAKKGDLEDFAVKIATDHVTVEEIAVWFSEHL